MTSEYDVNKRQTLTSKAVPPLKVLIIDAVCGQAR